MEVLNLVTTGDELTKKYGFTPTIVPLATWPDEKQKFLIAEEVKEFGDFLIRTFRPDLRLVNIGYVFKQKASKSGDNVTLGAAKPQNELQKVLHNIDAVIEIGFDTWKDLTTDQKARLVDHELAHIGLNLDGSKIVSNPHPVEEFPEIVQRWGLGNDAQIDFIAAYNKFCENNKK
jgi:hypothetical protein